MGRIKFCHEYCVQHQKKVGDSGYEKNKFSGGSPQGESYLQTKILMAEDKGFHKVNQVLVHLPSNSSIG